ncbi:unnamed protein product [Absidia cylindrospora]
MQFLEPSQLFAPNGLGIGLPLLQCIDKSTREHSILISLPTAAQLSEYIGDRLQMMHDPVIPLHLYHQRGDYEVQVVTIDDKARYMKMSKQVAAANKRQRKLEDAQEDWRRTSDLLQDRQYVFISLDIEAFEIDHSILLEIGWTLYDSRHDTYMDQHYMIDTYRHLRNGKYVDDQRMNFGFGTSVWCTLPQALDELHKDLDWATCRDGGFVLVGHGLNSDLMYLKQCQFLWPTTDNSSDYYDGGVLDVQDSAMVTIVNTDTLYGAYIGDLHNPPSLGRCLGLMEIEHWNLHNAGNDAHYTMELMMKLMDKALD